MGRVVGVPAFFATGWVVVGWVEPATECATGFGALFAVELSAAYKPLGRQTNPDQQNKQELAGFVTGRIQTAPFIPLRQAVSQE